MTALIPVITTKGLASVWNAENTGVAGKIVAVLLGDQGYRPNKAQLGLQNRLVRVPIADGQRVSDTQIHVTALVDSGPAFWVREVAFELDNGQLLAIWSDPDTPLAYRSPLVPLLLAFDLVLDALPAGSITVVGTGANLSLAAWGAQYVAQATAIIDNMTRNLNVLFRTMKLEKK